MYEVVAFAAQMHGSWRSAAASPRGLKPRAIGTSKMRTPRSRNQPASLPKTECAAATPQITLDAARLQRRQQIEDVTPRAAAGGFENVQNFSSRSMTVTAATAATISARPVCCLRYPPALHRCEYSQAL
jgi:hypothetical protein